MQNAARTHWRAAAWLLERTDPEMYARRPANTAHLGQVETALMFLIEAALRAAIPEDHSALYEHLQAASDEALNFVFPNLSQWGRPIKPKLPPTPLTNRERHEANERNPKLHVGDYESPLGTPRLPQALAQLAVQSQAAAGLEAPSAASFQPQSPHRPILSPKIAFATEFASDKSPAGPICSEPASFIVEPPASNQTGDSRPPQRLR